MEEVNASDKLLTKKWLYGEFYEQEYAVERAEEIGIPLDTLERMAYQLEVFRRFYFAPPFELEDTEKSEAETLADVVRDAVRQVLNERCPDVSQIASPADDVVTSYRILDHLKTHGMVVVDVDDRVFRYTNYYDEWQRFGTIVSARTEEIAIPVRIIVHSDGK